MHLVYKVFKAAIHFHLLSSARLPMNIRLTSPLHTIHVRYFPFRFRKFSQILSISGADENRWSYPRNFARPLCPLCIRFVSVGQWDRAIYQIVIKIKLIGLPGFHLSYQQNIIVKQHRYDLSISLLEQNKTQSHLISKRKLIDFLCSGFLLALLLVRQRMYITKSSSLNRFHFPGPRNVCPSTISVPFVAI